jgi:hypothetical protein
MSTTGQIVPVRAVRHVIPNLDAGPGVDQQTGRERSVGTLGALDAAGRVADEATISRAKPPVVHVMCDLGCGRLRTRRRAPAGPDASSPNWAWTPSDPTTGAFGPGCVVPNLGLDAFGPDDGRLRARMRRPQSGLGRLRTRRRAPSAPDASPPLGRLGRLWPPLGRPGPLRPRCGRLPSPFFARNCPPSDRSCRDRGRVAGMPAASARGRTLLNGASRDHRRIAGTPAWRRRRRPRGPTRTTPDPQRPSARPTTPIARHPRPDEDDAPPAAPIARCPSARRERHPSPDSRGPIPAAYNPP